MKNEKNAIALDNQIFEIESHNKNYLAKNKSTTYIHGEWSNWRPQPMEAIEDLCYKLDTKREDSIARLKRNQQCR